MLSRPVSEMDGGSPRVALMTTKLSETTLEGLDEFGEFAVKPARWGLGGGSGENVLRCCRVSAHSE